MASDAEDGARAVYDAHYGPLVGWTTRLVGDLDEAHALATAAFVRLLRQWSSVEDPRTWLYSDVVRGVLGSWRVEEERLASPMAPDPAGPTPADPTSVAGSATVRDVVRALPDPYREVVLLWLYADLPIADVSAATSRPEGVLRRELAQALRARREATGAPAAGAREEAAEAEQYFAGERAAARRVRAGEDRWEQILHQAARQQRSWFGPVAAMLAVVAVLIGGWSVRQQPFGVGEVGRGPQVGEASSSAPAVASGVPQRRSAAQVPRAVPASFVPWSLSNSGSGTLYGIGSTECVDEVCPTVVRSTDNGSTWAAVHVFRRTDTASVNSDEVPRVQPTGAVTEVRFATPKIGFAFGGDLWITRDAGRSFTAFPHPGQTVLDVEISGDDVLVLSADGCTQGECAGPLMLSRTTVQGSGSGIRQPTVVRSLDPSRPVNDAQLVVRDGMSYLQTYRVDGDQEPPWRLGGRTLIPMLAPRSACGSSALREVTVATNGPGTLFALCGGTLRGEQAEYVLLRSDDFGRSWRRSASTPLLLPRIGRVSLAASDASHLTVGTGGPRQASGPTNVTDPSRLLQVTSDAGRTWRPVTKPAPPLQGVDWVASPGGREVYAITRSGSPIWRTADFGATWHTVDPSRAVNPPAPTGSASASG